MKEKRAQKNQIRVMLLPEYGKQRLLAYADSFKELADSFAGFNMEADIAMAQASMGQAARGQTSVEQGPMEQGSMISLGALDRSTMLSRKKAHENREIMAEHLKEMAQIMAEVAGASFAYQPLSERRIKQIAHELKPQGIQVKEIHYIEGEEGRLEIGAALATEKGKPHTGEEAAHLFSVIFDKRLMVSRETDYYLDEKFRDFRFIEEPRYSVLTGTARATKEYETVSGDNFCQFETDKRGMTLMLSDGMGSGEKACADSLQVLDLMERMLAAGFSGDMAVQLVNTSLNLGEEENHLATLDVCSLDLYEGSLTLTKVGASSTYIKRDNLVEQISSRNLPLGVLGKPEPEVTARKLMDGDYVIMVSDGVLDGLSQGIGEEALSEVISRTSLENPGEMAGSILNYVIRACKGAIRDDMTVIVAGIWENPV